MISIIWENYWTKLKNWNNYWSRFSKCLILAIQRCILKLTLIITNHSKSAILANLIMSRELLINMTITISKLGKYQ
jgi:hypothetical protein